MYKVPWGRLRVIRPHSGRNGPHPWSRYDRWNKHNWPRVYFSLSVQVSIKSSTPRNVKKPTYSTQLNIRTEVTSMPKLENRSSRLPHSSVFVEFTLKTFSPQITLSLVRFLWVFQFFNWRYLSHCNWKPSRWAFFPQKRHNFGKVLIALRIESSAGLRF